MEVANIEVDLINYKKPQDYKCKEGELYTHDILEKSIKDFQVAARYETDHRFTILVKRLDDNDGWEDELEVCVYYCDTYRKEIVRIGKSKVSEKELQINTGDDVIHPSNKKVELLPMYRLAPRPRANCINRDEFNMKFGTDIVTLPTRLYAVGLLDGETYIYNELRDRWFEIMPQ